MKQNLDHNSFRDFEYIAGMDAWPAKLFQAYIDDQTAKGQLNYRLHVSFGYGPNVTRLPPVNITCVRFSRISKPFCQPASYRFIIKFKVAICQRYS